MANLAFVFGLLGNIVSFCVYLAPLPTFREVYKRKSTEQFQALPYVVALFSAMLWIYYALLKANAMLLITINSVGCVIETAYIIFFLIYAPKKARLHALMLIGGMNVVGLGLIVVVSQFMVHEGGARLRIVGWICLVFSLSVFVAPLGVVRQVIKTKSVEYMPFLLSLFLTLSAVMWFLYGLLVHDLVIAIPNVLGFTFGIIQMGLYLMFKNAKKAIDQKTINVQDKIIALEEQKFPDDVKDHMIDVVKLSAIMCNEILPVVAARLNENIHEKSVIEAHPPIALPVQPIEVKVAA